MRQAERPALREVRLPKLLRCVHPDLQVIGAEDYGRHSSSGSLEGDCPSRARRSDRRPWLVLRPSPAPPLSTIRIHYHNDHTTTFTPGTSPSALPPCCIWSQLLSKLSNRPGSHDEEPFLQCGMEPTTLPPITHTTFYA